MESIAYFQHTDQLSPVTTPIIIIIAVVIVIITAATIATVIIFIVFIAIAVVTTVFLINILPVSVRVSVNMRVKFAVEVLRACVVYDSVYVGLKDQERLDSRQLAEPESRLRGNIQDDNVAVADETR